MQYENYCSTENLKTKEYQKKLEELQEIQKEVYGQKDNQDMQSQMITALINSKDQQLKEQSDSIEHLEKKLEELNTYVQNSKIDPDDPMGQDKAEMARQKVLATIKAQDE